MKKTWRRKMAAVLSALLVLGNLWPGAGIYAEAAVRNRVIEELEELPGDILFQTVPFGTKKKDLNLPGYLNAGFGDEDEMAATSSDMKYERETGAPAAAGSDAEEETGAPATGSDADAEGSLPGGSSGGNAAGSGVSGGRQSGWKKVKVNWVLNEDFSEQETYDGQIPGIYVFEAELSGGRYELGGAELPAIEVEVLDEEDEIELELESTPSDAQEETQKETLEETAEEIPVTDWTYLDGENLSEDGSLTLYGAEDGISFEEVVSLLPSRIEAVTGAVTDEVTGAEADEKEDAEAGGFTKILPLTWDCPEYLENRKKIEENDTEGSRTEDGIYLFEGKLPAGYVLSEEAGEIEIPVTAKALEGMSLEEQAKRMEQAMELAASRQNAPASRRQNASALSSGKAAVRSGNGGGVPSEFTFAIGSEQVLRELQEKVNSGEAWLDGRFPYAESHYVLTGDIDLVGSWTPIGTGEQPFSGIFDGDGHTIGGVAVRPSSGEYAGLFGLVEGGTIQDLGVTGAEVSAEGNAGILAGALRGGGIVRCYTAGTVTVSGDGSHGGGIIGSLIEASARGNSGGSTDGTVEDCYSRAAVSGESGEDQMLGGIAGFLGAGRLEGCYSTGAVAGDKQTVRRSLGGIAGYAESGSYIRFCIAMNPSVDNFDYDGPDALQRVTGIHRITGVDGGLSDGSEAHLEGNYGFAGMRVNGGKSVYPSGTDADAPGGCDFTYTEDGGFYPPLDTVLTDGSAWETRKNVLPTLRGIGGQDKEIPPWISAPVSQDVTLIHTEADLKAFRDRVNSGESYANKTVKLAADIDLTGEWTPIGKGGVGIENHPFSGVFDGDGHVISGVRMDVAQEYGEGDYVGLFGMVDGGTICNLGVKNADIKVIRKEGAGAVAGRMIRGAIRNCYATGRVYVYGGSGSSAGGLIGGGGSITIANCYSKVDVENKSKTGCSSGLLGDAIGNAVIVNCYSTGKVSGSKTAAGILGDSLSGIKMSILHCAALNPSIDGTEYYSRITNSFISYSFAYAFSGMRVNGRPISSDMENGQAGKDLVYRPSQGNFDTPWETVFSEEQDEDDRTLTEIWDIRDGSLPILKGIGGQDGTIPSWILEAESGQADLYISTEAELKAFRDLVNGGNSFESQKVRLTADIRLTEDWEPIGKSQGWSFKGTFDGGGHVIRGLRVRDGEVSGLFGLIVGGTVENLGLEGADITGRFAGSVAGELYENGTISGCYSRGGTVTGQVSAGGIVGDSAISAVVRNCYSTGRVAGEGTYGVAGGITGVRLNQSPGDAQRFKDRIEHCYSTAEVLGRSKAGGIIGDAMKYITVSHNAALNTAVGITGIEDNSQSGNIGRITSEPLYPTYFTGEGNYALSGMPVNKETVQGDDGSGKNGKDGELAAITQDPVLFPDTDWVRAEGCYPVLKVFAGQQPIPFGEMLEEQGEGRTVGIVLDAPDTWTFPEVSEGYGPQPEKAVTVRSTGTMETEALTVELTEQSADFTGVGTAAAAPYFILSDTRLESIAPGASAEFTVKPAGGLAAGTYRAKVVARGSYGQKDTMAVSFTVKEVPVVYYSVTVENDGNGTAGADRDRAAEGTPVKLTAKPNAGYHFKEWQNADTLTFIEGDINSPAAGITMPGRNVTVKAVFEADTRPEQLSGGSGGSSDSGVNPYILHGSWQRLENGIWQFRLMSGEYAKSRWGLIGGRWYYFDAEGNMATGWRYIGGAWYFLATEEDTKRMEGIKEGIMITGWYFDPFYQKWFYLDTNGAMVTGWKEIDGKWYYFNPVSDGAKGAMAVNTWIDGRYVDENGVRV